MLLWLGYSSLCSFVLFCFVLFWGKLSPRGGKKNDQKQLYFYILPIYWTQAKRKPLYKRLTQLGISVKTSSSGNSNWPGLGHIPSTRIWRWDLQAKPDGNVDKFTKSSNEGLLKVLFCFSHSSWINSGDIYFTRK